MALADNLDRNKLLKSIDNAAKELIVDSLYTGRGHQQAGLRYYNLNYLIGVPASIISAVSSSGAALTAIFGANQAYTALLAIIATIFTSLRAFLKTDKLAEEHALKGRRYISLRNDVRIFRDIDLNSGQSIEELRKQLDAFRKRYNDLNEIPPLHIPRKDYLAAKKSIEAGESSYIGDKAWEELQ
jgi:SMODS and SLOG-associating 2TM effector domain family 4